MTAKIVKKWEPIDFYNGADHATAHLLYARFIGHFFNKIGLVNEPEPFKQFLFNGKVTAQRRHDVQQKQGQRHRSAGNHRSGLWRRCAAHLPDVRGAAGAVGPMGSARRAGHAPVSIRLWTLVQEYDAATEVSLKKNQEENLLRATHKMIKKVTEDIENNHYNTAIAALMECVNTFYKLKTEAFGKNKIWQQALESTTACVAPFAPHIGDELWQQLGHSLTVHIDNWPEWEERHMLTDTITVAIQVNGKLRGQVVVDAEADEETVVAVAKGNEKVTGYLKGKKLRKTVYVPGKLVNFVV